MKPLCVIHVRLSQLFDTRSNWIVSRVFVLECQYLPLSLWLWGNLPGRSDSLVGSTKIHNQESMRVRLIKLPLKACLNICDERIGNNCDLKKQAKVIGLVLWIHTVARSDSLVLKNVHLLNRHNLWENTDLTIVWSNENHWGDHFYGWTTDWNMQFNYFWTLEEYHYHNVCVLISWL